MQKEYQQISYLNNLYEIFLLLLRLNKFWKKVKIKSKEIYLQEIDCYKIGIKLFYNYGAKYILTNNVIFTKHYIPRITYETLEMLNCGARLQIMQGFEHRNK